MDALNKIVKSVDYLKDQGFVPAQVGVILGTGLGKSFLQEMQIEKSLDYKSIPGFPIATVEFHSGKLHYGSLQGKKIIAMQGRFHAYEGYSTQEVTFPVRVLKKLGVQTLLISNAAGNLRKDWHKGELMLIEDHINLQPENPLRGPNINELGPRFPDMSKPYAPSLSVLLRDIAKQKNIVLREGVYASVLGPNLETRAEYRYLQRIGADAVGMSTVPEVIVAVHCGLPCAAVSVLTDDCDPDHLEAVSIENVIALAATAEPKLSDLYIELISHL